MAAYLRDRKVIDQRRTRWMPLAGIILLTLAALGMVGCAGLFQQAPEAQAFEQWSRADQRWYGGRNAALDRAAEPSPPADPDSLLAGDAGLDDHIHYALKHNPELAAAFYRWRAALEGIPQARTLPDPRVSFGVILDQVERNTRYIGERYALEQMFPWFGKLDLGGDMALSRARAEARRFEAARLDLEDRVSRAYFEYAYQRQAADIARDNLELLLRLEAVVRTMFRGGAASLAEVNRAQIEIGRLDDRLRSQEDLIGVAAAELNAALGRPAHARLPAAPHRPSAQKVPALPDYPDDRWAALARRHNPELAAARQEAEQQRQAVALSHKNYYPDLSLGVEYTRNGNARMAAMDRGGTDTLGAAISVNLPIWRGKYSAGLSEAQARLAEAIRTIESRENRLDADLKRALFGHRDSLRKLELYGDTLLPLARQTLATTEMAFRVGRAGFSDLINAQRVLLEFALAHERAAADRAQSVSRIRALAGQLSGEPAEETASEGEGLRPSPPPDHNSR